MPIKNIGPSRYGQSLIAILLIALGLCGCGHRDAPTTGAAASPAASDVEVNAVPVEVALAARKPISASYTGTATLTADREAQVVAKTSGILLKLYVEEGAKVKTGQLLAKLDDESALLNVAKAEATLKKLQNDFRRSAELFDKKLVSSEQQDKIHYDLETQKAAYDLAKLELSYTHIVAPIDGVLSQRMVKEGNLIQEHQTLFKIDDFDPLLAVLNVPERELNTLKPDETVKMTVDALPRQSFGGRIARISPVVDAATGTFRVTCEFRDKTERLKSGMFGRLDIVYDHSENALTIPRTALIEEDGETAVYIIEPTLPMASPKVSAATPNPVGTGTVTKPPDNGTAAAFGQPTAIGLAAHRRLIKIGYIDGANVEIRDGLDEGAKVITVGRNAVRDGTVVHLLEPKP